MRFADMKQHEREYFTSRVRNGIYQVNLRDLKIKILPLTLEQEFEVQEAYALAFAEAEQDGLAYHEEMLETLRERGLWTEDDEKKEETLDKDVDKLKVELFNNRNRESTVETIRRYLATAKSELKKVRNKKYEHYDHTVEGFAVRKKTEKIVEVSCVNEDGSPYIFDDQSPKDDIVAYFGHSILEESIVRELARTEPWRSVWLLNETKTYPLFAHSDRQLTVDQRNIIIWSRMYDNVQESMDCPSDDVIQDDDMLDGWFLIQKKKQEQEKIKSEIEQSTQNSRIANSDEIFVMADSQDNANKINDSNTFHNQKVKSQRMQVINKQGIAEDLDFQDQQLKLRQQSNEMYKGKFRR